MEWGHINQSHRRLSHSADLTEKFEDTKYNYKFYLKFGAIGLPAEGGKPAPISTGILLVMEGDGQPAAGQMVSPPALAELVRRRLASVRRSG